MGEITLMLPMLLLSNLRLVVYLFGALVFCAMAWLYFDAMYVRPNKSVLARAGGALLIGLSYLLGAVVIEGISLEWIAWLRGGVEWLRLAGYLILGLGVWGEPLSKRPSYAEAPAGKPGVALMLGEVTRWMLPIIPGLVGLGYWRRASVGLERHLRGMAYGMYTLSLAEILDLRRLFTGSSDIRVYELTREFGNIWLAQLIILLLGLLLVSRWVFSYLLRRFETQITLFMGMLVMSVFAIATIVFTYIMANRLQVGINREVQAGAAITMNNWGREGDELVKRASELAKVDVSDKEALAKQLLSGEQILDSEGRDILSGEKVEGSKDGLGYRLVGIGSSRKAELTAVTKWSGGYVVVSREIDGIMLGQAAEAIGMAMRAYDNEVVIGASSVPGYPKIASPLGLRRKEGERLGGVAYVSGWVDLRDAEGVKVARLEAAIPMATLWGSIANALFWTYLAGVAVLILMELPAVLMARYLTRQLK